MLRFGISLDNKTCDICGTSEDLTRHHIIPQSVLSVIYTKNQIKHGKDGGSIVILCADCHTRVESSYKSNKYAHTIQDLINYVKNTKSDTSNLITVIKFQMNIYNQVYTKAKTNITKNILKKKERDARNAILNCSI